MNLPALGTYRTVKRNGTPSDTIKIMRDTALESAKDPYVKYLIDKYDLKADTASLERIFNYIFYNTTFKKDNKKRQTIRTLNNSLTGGLANCVDYSVAISQFLINLGIPHSFRMVKENAQSKYFSHVYVVLPDGLSMDLIVGQEQDGTEKYKSREERKNYFGFEVPYYQKMDLKVI